MEKTVTTNDLKKRTRILLKNGWYATIKDNAKGNTRLAEVEGWYTETGSVYSHEIACAMIDGQWVKIDHTPAQLKLEKQVNSLFG